MAKRKTATTRRNSATTGRKTATTRRKTAPGTSVAQLRAFALSLPGAVETITWGAPHYRVGGKIFGGEGVHEGRAVTTAKLEKAHAEALLLDPRFTAAPYVGRYGWVQFALEDVTPAELETLVAESHRLVGPKRPAAAAPGSGAPRRTKTSTVRKSTRVRPAGTRRAAR